MTVPDSFFCKCFLISFIIYKNSEISFFSALDETANKDYS